MLSDAHGLFVTLARDVYMLHSLAPFSPSLPSTVASPVAVPSTVAIDAVGLTGSLVSVDLGTYVSMRQLVTLLAV